MGGTLVAHEGLGAGGLAAAVLGLHTDELIMRLRDILYKAPLSPDEAARRLCAVYGQNIDTRHRLAQALRNLVTTRRTVDGALAALTWCRTHRLKISVLSNCASFDTVDIEAMLGPIDFAVNSWQWGVCKPERAAFAVVETGLDLAPQEMVFVGDDPELDIAAARAAGWRTILVGSAGDSTDGHAIVPTLRQLPGALARMWGKHPL